MDEVWDPHWFGPTKTLDVHISWLRKKIEDDPSEPRYIVDRPRRRVPVRVGRGRRGERRHVATSERRDHEGSQPTHPGLHLPGRHGAARADRAARDEPSRSRPCRAGDGGPDERADDRRQVRSRDAEAGTGAGPMVNRSADQVQGRVIATDRHRHRAGRLGRHAVGENFNTPLRPEMQTALCSPTTQHPTPSSATATRRGADALFAAAPVVDPGLIGAVRITKDDPGRERRGPPNDDQLDRRHRRDRAVRRVGDRGHHVGFPRTAAHETRRRPRGGWARAISRRARTTSPEPMRSRSWRARSTRWPTASNAPSMRSASSWRTRRISSARRSPA